EEEGFVHPKRAATVRENDDETGKIDGDVVGEHGLSVNVARSGENGGASMNHYGHAVGLGAFVHSGERAEAVAISVGREELVRRMNFEAANAEMREAVDFGAGIGNVFWVNGAEGQKARRFGGTVGGDPVVHFGRKADDVGADVVDEAGALDACFVEKIEEGFC